MAKTGKVLSFNEDKAFGFVSPDDGGMDVFIHADEYQGVKRNDRTGKIEFFPKRKAGTNAPVPGDSITFEIIEGRNGKPRAKPWGFSPED